MKEPVREFHVLNLGAGVQSTTLYLMFLRGEMPVELDAAIFADPGEEPAAVYRHLAWMQSLGGPKIIVRSVGSRLGDDLRVGRNSMGQRFAAIPAFTQMPPLYHKADEELTEDDRLQLELAEQEWAKGYLEVAEELREKVGQTRRQCSKEYKVEVIERSIRRDIVGLAPGQRIPKTVRVHQYVGISSDEAGRFIRLQKRRKLGSFHAPLIDRHMTRKDCIAWLQERGEVPHEVPRSACVFCPFHDDAEWERVKSVPEDWARAVEVDESLRLEGSVANRGMDAPMYVHRTCQPLVQIDFRPRVAKHEAQTTLGFWREDTFSRECLGVCGL